MHAPGCCPAQQLPYMITILISAADAPVAAAAAAVISATIADVKRSQLLDYSALSCSVATATSEQPQAVHSLLSCVLSRGLFSGQI